MKSYFILKTVAFGLLTVAGVNAVEGNISSSNTVPSKIDSLCAVSYTATTTDFKKDIFILNHGARVSFKDTVVTAEKISMNKTAGQLKAVKNVTLKVGNKVVQKGLDSLTVNLPRCK